MDSKAKQMVVSVAAFALSAGAWFFGTGLHPYWFLTWLAPLPVLFAAPRITRWWAYAIAFGSFAVGSLNMWSYDRVLTPLWLSLLIVIGPSLVFAWIVSVHRRFVGRGRILHAAFATPVLWSAFEYLLEFRSPHSTFGNLAYSQMNFLPLLQIVSITGIWSVSFLIFFFSSSIAALLAPGGGRLEKRVIASSVALIFAVVFGYGFYRLHSDATSPRVTAGLIASDVPRTLGPSGSDTVALVRAYADHVPLLAAQGAEVVIVPEKIGRIKGDDLAKADAILEKAARENHVTILVSFEHQPNLNEARLYSPDGQLEGTYEKHHMLPAFESHLLPGSARLSVDRPSGKWGIAICKDMDFPLLSRQYVRDGVGLMLVPAWDFVVDGWLHGRMAILRGVESGFSIARAPKQGILTLTDDRGRILAERDSGSAPFTSLVGAIAVRNEPTFYARTGDWFAWLNLMFVVVLFLPVNRKSQKDGDRISN